MEIQQFYSVAIYCRLSVDDGTNLESMSIASQKTMLTEYVKKQGWKLNDIYVDDGYSGVNFERPAFQRMIHDIEQGRINLVIVKDLSRLGRNYIMCGQYTEIYFPEKNVRFIALNDGIDTLYSNNDIAPFKNILNDMYAKDISVKIRSSLHAKARKDEFLAPYAPYGFLKSPEDKHILIINEEVAPHIRKMFELSASGNSTKKIVKILEEDGVLTPLDYRNFKSHNSRNGKFQKKYSWAGAVVRDILRNPVYAGHNVQCKKRVQSYRTKKIVPNKREDWIIVENMHQAIVSQELFDTVQKALNGRLRFVKNTGEPQIFSKLFYCAECGRCMLHHDRTNHPKYYSCGKYRENGANACTSHHITYDNLCEIVLNDILVQQELARRNSKRKVNSKTTTEQGKYGSKYALTELLICGECGTPFRRCTWNVHGNRRIVWRCISRLDHGSRYCHNSPTIHEEPLHRAIVKAVNDFYICHEDIAKLLKESAVSVLSGLADNEIQSIEKRLKEIDKARNDFVELIANGACGAYSLDNEFAQLFAEEEKMSEKLLALKSQNQASAETQSSIENELREIENTRVSSKLQGSVERNGLR